MEKQRDTRLSALPEKPLAWLPSENLSGYKEAPPIRDGLLLMMVDLADNLEPHTEQAQHSTLCCGGLIVSGCLIGAKEYFDGMRDTALEGAGELMAKYKRASAEALEKLLPDTERLPERLPERREEWDDFYEPDDRHDAPDYIHLEEVTVHYSQELPTISSLQLQTPLPPPSRLKLSFS